MKNTDAYIIREMTAGDNGVIAKIIRYNLKQHNLDIPGTAYFDSMLDSLYEYYSADEKRGYYVLTDADDNVVGGIGLDYCPLFDECAELQKLYLADSAKGYGLGYRLISYVEDKMKEKGYKASYLETHTNLSAAMHIYEKSGYCNIARPKEIVHSAMDNFYFKKLG